MNVRLLALTLALPVVAAAPRALADGPTAPMDLQNFMPGSGPSEGPVLRAAEVVPHRALGFGFLAHAMYRPLVLRDASGGTSDALQYALTADFALAVGLFDRFQIGLQVPVVLAQAGSGLSLLETGGAASTSLRTTAVRDVRFEASAVIVRRNRVRDAQGFGLRIDLGGAIPVGDEAQLQGAPTWSFLTTIAADYRRAGFGATVNLGARVRGISALADVAFGHQLLAGLGVSYRPPVHDRFAIALESVTLVPIFSVPQGPALGGNTTTLRAPLSSELFLGARYAIDRARDLEVSLGGAAPLTLEPGTPAFRVMAGIAYMPHGFDTDGDGVLDGADSCPTQLEDVDNFQDTDGCPDPDNDGDHVLDVCDRCPGEAEDVDNYEDADGCPDPDNDGDGVPDADDVCATTAAGAHPDPARTGCPIPDADGDGILDPDDVCPAVAAGTQADPGRAGCPLEDRDHDGVGDGVDECPSDPAGAHADPYRPGCPDPDVDHDGVPNEIDRCADQPETVNGRDDADGCPDSPEATLRVGRGRVTFENVVRLRRGIRRLSTAERSLFAQAAQLLRGQSTGIERVRVEVVPASATPAAQQEAARLATLVRDAIVAGGFPTDRTAASASATPAATPAGAGEVRVLIDRRGSASP